MATVIMLGGKGNGSTTASSTSYTAIGHGSNIAGNATESIAQVPSRTVGFYSNISINVSTNSRGSSTYKFRKNTANGNQSITIGASQTGYFEDLINQDSVVLGDLVCTQLITGAGGTSFIFQVNKMSFTVGNGNTVQRFMNPAGTSNNLTAAGTYFFCFSADGRSTTTETNNQWRTKIAGTLRNAYLNVSANTWTANITASIRQNATSPASNITMTILAGVATSVEDTTHTVAVAVDDLLCWQIVLPAGSGSVSINTLTLEFLTTQDSFPLIMGGATTGGTLTNFYALCSFAGSTIESQVQTVTRFNAIWTKLNGNILTNADITTNVVVNFRQNGNSVGTGLTWAAGTTGYKEDLTSAISIRYLDNINMVVVSSGDTISLSYVSSVMTQVVQGS